jgi:uncharacterized protein YbcI
MEAKVSTINEQLARAVRTFHQQQTGHMPKNVTVALNEDTLVVTLHEAFSPAERALAQSPEGAAKLRELHQQLFQSSVGLLRQDIETITGRKVREAAAEVDPGTGSVVHTFTTGTTVQVFLLDGHVSTSTAIQNDAGTPAKHGRF